MELEVGTKMSINLKRHSYNLNLEDTIPSFNYLGLVDPQNIERSMQKSITDIKADNFSKIGKDLAVNLKH